MIAGYTRENSRLKKELAKAHAEMVAVCDT